MMVFLDVIHPWKHDVLLHHMENGDMQKFRMCDVTRSTLGLLFTSCRHIFDIFSFHYAKLVMWMWTICQESFYKNSWLYYAHTTTLSLLFLMLLFILNRELHNPPRRSFVFLLKRWIFRGIEHSYGVLSLDSVFSFHLPHGGFIWENMTSNIKKSHGILSYITPWEHTKGFLKFMLLYFVLRNKPPWNQLLFDNLLRVHHKRLMSHGCS